MKPNYNKTRHNKRGTYRLNVPSHYLKQCWDIVNWNSRNKLQWNFKRNSNIFIQENPFENIIWKMASILSRTQCVTVYWDVNGPIISITFYQHDRSMSHYLYLLICSFEVTPSLIGCPQTWNQPCLIAWQSDCKNPIDTQIAFNVLFTWRKWLMDICNVRKNRSRLGKLIYREYVYLNQHIRLVQIIVFRNDIRQWPKEK